MRRLLRENDLRLEQVPGSGKDGRVLKGDVLAYLESGSTAGGEPVAAATETSSAAAGTRPAETRVEPLRGVRAAMAKRMVESASTIPHFQYGEEIDVTELLALRERLKPRAEAEEMRLTLMPFFMKALALAVEAYPILNSRLDAEAEEIHYLPHCNVGMAVDGKAGLMVPNVKHVEHRSLLEIAGEVQRLTADARDGRVSQADLRDGTISISNIGAWGNLCRADHQCPRGRYRCHRQDPVAAAFRRQRRGGVESHHDRHLGRRSPADRRRYHRPVLQCLEGLSGGSGNDVARAALVRCRHEPGAIAAVLHSGGPVGLSAQPPRCAQAARMGGAVPGAARAARLSGYRTDRQGRLWLRVRRRHRAWRGVRLQVHAGQSAQRIQDRLEEEAFMLEQVAIPAFPS